jgi:hypothetical protein
MDQLLVRTCSADDATVLAREAGRCARVGPARVRIHRPVGRQQIETTGSARYVARIELLDAAAEPDGWAGPDAAAVVSSLFGPYLA